MDDRKEILNNHYNKYNEDSEPIKDNSYMIEHVTTTNYIQKYLVQIFRIFFISM